MSQFQRLPFNNGEWIVITLGLGGVKFGTKCSFAEKEHAVRYAQTIDRSHQPMVFRRERGALGSECVCGEIYSDEVPLTCPECGNGEGDDPRVYFAPEVHYDPDSDGPEGAWMVQQDRNRCAETFEARAEAVEAAYGSQ